MNSRKWLAGGFLATVLALGGLAAASAYWAVPGSGADLAGSLARAQERPTPGGKLAPAEARAAEKAIRDTAKAFSTAFAKGDVEEVLGFWTPDGEYVTEASRAYRGKGQLRVLLKKILANNKGAKHSVTINSVRFLKPDVAQEEGTVTLSSVDGAHDRTHYVALWVQHGGKWLLASVRDIPTPAEDDKPAAYHRLRQLSWLVGEWQEKNGETQLKCVWAPGQAALLFRWTIKQPSGSALEIDLRLGWDPVNQRMRSWLFDSTGGYGEAVWQRDGNTWVVEGEGFYPDGKPAASTNRWKFIDSDTFHWSATGRSVDEMPLPDVEATFVRKGAKADPTRGTP